MMTEGNEGAVGRPVHLGGRVVGRLVRDEAASHLWVGRLPSGMLTLPRHEQHAARDDVVSAAEWSLANGSAGLPVEPSAEHLDRRVNLRRVRKGASIVALDGVRIGWAVASRSGTWHAWCPFTGSRAPGGDTRMDAARVLVVRFIARAGRLPSIDPGRTFEDEPDAAQR